MSVMNMSYEMIDMLFNGLERILKEEAAEQKKRDAEIAAKVKKNGR